MNAGVCNPGFTNIYFNFFGGFYQYIYKVSAKNVMKQLHYEGKLLYNQFSGGEGDVTI